MTAPALLAEALKDLPHGPEFRFLDRLTALEPGRAGTGEYTVRGDEVFLRGHFPGVLLIEAATQLAGVVAQSEPNVPKFAGLKLTAVRSAKISGTAQPGEVLRLEARIQGRLGNLVQAQISAAVGTRTVLQGEVTLSGEISPAGRAAC